MYRTFIPRTLSRLFLCSCLLGLPQLQAQSAPPNLSRPVSLETALHWALERDPTLQRLETEEDAAEGQIEQADVRPNPTVEAEVENILGTGPFEGVDGAEITLSVRQVIETADKRQKRTTLARRERALVDWDRELRRAEVEASVRAAFIEVLLAQRTLELRQQLLGVAQDSEGETSRLVEAARAPQVEATRARLAVRQQQFAVQRAQQALTAARQGLATWWDVASPPAFEVTGELQLEAETPSLEQLQTSLAQTAAISRYEAVREKRSAAVELEEARARPDFELFAGGRYTRDNDGDAAFLAGVAMPWPLFDRNEGNIRTARARLRAVTHERAETRRTLSQALSIAYQELTAAAHEAQTVEQELIPAARQTLSETEEGYQRGQFTQLAVLDSRAALYEVQEAYLDALRRYAHAEARITALTRPAQIQR
ncbi:MAG: Outer membrane efflux protein [Puniceicoccaceae bacterium 5H]|nr:MAG: Outer membrane efflux protein [Puniceicoccaceae bacterium 5H]